MKQIQGVQPGALPAGLDEMLRAFRLSRVLLTAIELDVFSAVGGGATAREVSQRTGTSQRAVEMLLNVLAAMKLLDKSGPQYTNGEWTRQFLCADSPDDQRLSLLHTARLWHRWSTLTDCLKEGTAVALKQGLAREARDTEAFIAAMHVGGTQRAQQAAAAVDLSGVRKSLDLGGGSGAYSIAFAKANPQLDAAIFDLPGVIPLTRQYVAQAGLEKRIRFVEGDLAVDDFGAGYDLVFISSVCHIFGPDENVKMLSKAYRALAAGGRVVIADFIVNQAKTAPLGAVLFALNMLVNTANGDVYSAEEYADFLTRAGFSGIEKIETGGPVSLMIGWKRSA